MEILSKEAVDLINKVFNSNLSLPVAYAELTVEIKNWSNNILLKDQPKEEKKEKKN